MTSFVQKVLHVAERNGFLLSSGTKTDYFKFGPAGQLLRNNVSHEWFYSNSVDTVDNVFPIGQEFCKSHDWRGV